MKTWRTIPSKTVATLAAAVLMASAAATSLADSHSGMKAAAAVTVTAEVVAINQADRHVTLVGPQGDAVEIAVGDEVRNFDQIEVGDKVRVKYFESLAVYLGEPGSLPTAKAGVIAGRAAKGEKPAGMVAESIDVSASVVAIDRQRREVTLVLRDGTTTTTDVDPKVEAFDRLKIGDSVHARITRAVAISVEPHGKP